MSAHHDRIIHTMLRSLARGCPVVTADGEQIGTLAEVAEDAVKVDVPLRPDFWINADYVVACDRGRIELSFIKSDLGAYRMKQPAPPDDPLVEQKTDHVVTEVEQQETRLRMEQELAEQREELPHLHPRGEEGPPDTFGTLGEPVESELAREGIDARAGARAEGWPDQARSRSWAVALAVVPFAVAAWWVWRRRSRR